jgi:Pentapeptide repeats (8 copies)
MLHTSSRREESRVDQEQQDGQQQQPRWPPTRKQLLWASGIGAVLTVAVVVIGYRYDITLWDWLKLLVVPAVIAAGGLWFNKQQQERQREDDRRQQERGLEIENQRAQDEALQAYLDQMGQLLLDQECPLRQSKEEDDVRTLARARTLTVLPRLDGGRKGSVVQFLHESGLIATEHRVLDLTEANLRGVDLRQARGTNLRGANLSETNLHGAILTHTKLIGADLSGTDLIGADLRGADLRGPPRWSEETRGPLFTQPRRIRILGSSFAGS